ncbi:acyl-CoA dehydrogenase family protein [Streptomyces macrosporus]|uniref:Acyl-CoA dehydrogenase family protein n=1 Tax=Streptomyces macrosporus TaxID=44032 RepID=A0ABP5XGU5_9ACTN
MSSATHTPAGGPAPLTACDVFSSDRALVEGVDRYADAGRAAEVRAEPAGPGRAAGSAGGRPEPDGELGRTAALLVWAQVDPGHGLSLSAAHAVAAALRADPGLAAAVPLPSVPPAHGLGDGTGDGARPAAGVVTPRGPDGIRAEPGPDGTEEAEGREAEGRGHVLAGRGRLRPAAAADVLLVRARTADGPAWFLAPRTLPDGTRNGPSTRRPADGSGAWPGPAAEVEFDGTARARRIGGEDRGPAAAVTETLRLDRVTCSAAVLRQAVTRAVHHAAHHGAPGEEGPTRNVLADLAVESEAATALALRLAAARDGGTDRDRALLRAVVPAAAYWVAGRCAPVAAEALDLLGDDGCAGGPGTPPLPREAPPDPAGESGGALALEALRVVREDPEALTAVLSEIGRARGADHRLDGAIRDLLGELADLEGIEARARRPVERMVLVLQGALLVRHAPPEVADAFCASRLGGERGTAFGTLPAALDLAAIVERARPAVG